MDKLTRYAPIVARVLLGLVFLVFGLNGFLNFIPQPPMEGQAAAFMGGLGASGYFFPLLKATEVVVGALLLAGVFVPLALLVLAPVTLNILAFHAFLAPAGLPMAVILIALHLYLAYAYRGSFRGVLNSAAKPANARPAESRAERVPAPAR